MQYAIHVLWNNDVYFTAKTIYQGVLEVLLQVMMLHLFQKDFMPVWLQHQHDCYMLLCYHKVSFSGANGACVHFQAKARYDPRVEMPLLLSFANPLWLGLHLHQLTYAFVVTNVLVSYMRKTRCKCRRLYAVEGRNALYALQKHFLCKPTLTWSGINPKSPTVEKYCVWVQIRLHQTACLTNEALKPLQRLFT